MLQKIAVSTALVLTLIAQASAQQISEEQAYEIAKDAYVYAYPLVLEYTTLIQAANYAEPTGIPAQAPFNQFGHAKAFPPADFKAVVRPNVDTLYSVANLDLGREPIVLSVPATDRVDYPYRAAVASYGLGMNLPQDAVYPSLSTDADGQPLDGNNKYVLHFDRDKFPPVEGFWSLTAYDREGYFIPNALNRQAVGDRSNLVSNADGSLDLYVQADSPGSAKEANWLPVAKGPFTLMLRLYAPKSEVLDRTWTPPPIAQAL
jgi:hypothetical protein